MGLIVKKRRIEVKTIEPYNRIKNQNQHLSPRPRNPTPRLQALPHFLPRKPWMNGKIEDNNHGQWMGSYGNENNGQIWNISKVRLKSS